MTAAGAAAIIVVGNVDRGQPISLGPSMDVQRQQPPAATWADLPTDLLLVLFAPLPPLALIRSISLVCKRWRVVALRSITSFTFRGGDLLGLSALPSLTSLDIMALGRSSSALPTTLRSLTLNLGPLGGTSVSLLEAILLGSTPLLTSLSISGVRSVIITNALDPFLQKTVSRLTHMQIDGLAAHAMTLVRYYTPSLHTLRILSTDDDVILRRYLGLTTMQRPRLANLDISSSHREFPVWLRTAVTCLHVTSRFRTPEHAGLLATLPRLQEIWADEDLFGWHDTRLVALTLPDCLHYAPLGLPRLRRLSVQPNDVPPALPPSLRLPMLSSLRLVGMPRQWRVTDVIHVVRFAMQATTALRDVALKVEAIHDRLDARKQIGDLFTHMVQYGVSSVSVATSRAGALAALVPPAAIKYGWLRVELNDTDVA